MINYAAEISRDELLAIENASDMHSSVWDSIHVHPRVLSCETRVSSNREASEDDARETTLP